ncbi:MAG: hypothetical protein QNJ05_07145 [Woeseiaceae bacterium]|nr:hypothetical protein [Woeseiaceae bacterium]
MPLRIALIASAATPILHTLVLILSGQDAIRDPINELSRQEWSGAQTIGLTLFGIAHIALAIGLQGLDRGRLWPYGRAFLAASGAVLFFIAYFFATAETSALRGPNANDPLWVVASLMGLAMGALQPGLSRISPKLGLFSAICLGIWLWLVPLILLVNDSWLGAYERIVGTVYVVWMIGVSAELLHVRAKIVPEPKV